MINKKIKRRNQKSKKKVNHSLEKLIKIQIEKRIFLSKKL